MHRQKGNTKFKAVEGKPKQGPTLRFGSVRCRGCGRAKRLASEAEPCRSLGCSRQEGEESGQGEPGDASGEKKRKPHPEQRQGKPGQAI